MENKIISIEEISKTVAEVTKFDVTKQELEAKVLESKKIDVTDLVAVKAGRIAMRGIEIGIEKRGKAARDIFTAANREIKTLESELLEVTNPEVKRLEDIEAEAEKKRLWEEQMSKVPARREKLNTIGVEIIIEDIPLGALKDHEFESYYNQLVANKLEDDRLKMEREAEAKRKADEAVLVEERRVIKIEQDRVAAEAEVLRQTEAKKLADKQAELDVQQKKIDDEKHRIEVLEAEIIGAANAKKEAEDIAFTKADAEKKAAALAESNRKKEEARQLALKPDKAKLTIYAKALLEVECPKLKTDEANTILAEARQLLTRVTNHLKQK
jgi:hypothetical protein